MGELTDHYYKKKWINWIWSLVWRPIGENYSLFMEHKETWVVACIVTKWSLDREQPSQAFFRNKNQDEIDPKSLLRYTGRLTRRFMAKIQSERIKEFYCIDQLHEANYFLQTAG